MRALTRTTSDRATVDGVRSAGAEIVEGNLLDPASLGAACQGAATVISTETAVRSAQADDDEIAGPRLAAGG